MKISKNHALNLIDSKISQFKKILNDATYDNRYNEEYHLAYYATENLLKELFSEEEPTNFRNNVKIRLFVFGDDTDYAQELQDYKDHVERCISQLKVYREKIQTFWDDGPNRIDIINGLIKQISYSWKQLENKGAKYPILLAIILLIAGFIISYYQIYPSHTSIATTSSTERAELTINNVSYNVDWRAVADGNSSELLNIDKYQVTVRTYVSNKNDSKFDAEITNTEYHFLDINNDIKNHWISKHETISIYPGITFTKSDKFEVLLKPGNYTLRTRIEYEDNNGVLTPLMFSAKLKISYYDSKIIDNQDWQ
jgi:hypothetical protein